MEHLRQSHTFPSESPRLDDTINYPESEYPNIKKPISLDASQGFPLKKRSQKRLSSENTEDNTIEMKLESKISDDCLSKEKEEQIGIQYDADSSCMERLGEYERAFSRKGSKTVSPSFVATEQEGRQQTRQVQIVDFSEEEQSQNSERKASKILPTKHRKIQKQSNNYLSSKFNKISENSLSKEGKRVSILIDEVQDLLLPGTNSIIMNSINSNSQQESVTIFSPGSNKLNNQGDEGNPMQNKENIDGKQKQGIFFANAHDIRGRSLKRVTFIGDSQPQLESNQLESPIKLKKQTFSTIKDDSSVTSILNTSSEPKRVKSHQSSRKIICQDDNYSLFRLVGFKKTDKKLMCRSVQIRDDTTELKQLKVYLLCRENEHDNIIRMHAFEKVGRDSNRNFVEIKMDFYPKNLQEYVLEDKKSHKKTSIQRKIILFQILKALNFIHSRKICHRDLNPHSIMVGDNLEVALTNFAYVKSETNSFSDENYFDCNCYIRPPEVILQPLRLFETGGDIWSFGCVVAYMLKGEMPFLKGSDAEMLLEIIKVLGVPSQQYLEKIGFKDKKRFVFPKMYRKTMRQTFLCEDSELLCLLQIIFVYNPSERAQASSLLASSYFDELRQQERFRSLRSLYNIEGLFSFKNGELAEEQSSRVVPPWYLRERS